MNASQRQQLAKLLLILTPAMWSLNYIVARGAVGHVHPHMLALLRWVLAGGLMLAIAWPTLKNQWPAIKKEWPDALLLGALGMWICGAWVYQGGKTTSATNISLLYAISPVLIALVSRLWFHERLSVFQIFGVALALCGTVVVILKGRLQTLAEFTLVPGDGWIMAAVLSWTAYSILLKRKTSVLDPFSRLTVITWGGVMVLLPFTAIEAVWMGLPDFSSWAVWKWVLIAAVFPGFMAYQAYSFMQRELGIAKTGLVLYLGPLWGSVNAWWMLGEPILWYHLLGALLILPGIYLATRAK
jgi:drug/metabolite transporter (DMT)-like permease